MMVSRSLYNKRFRAFLFFSGVILLVALPSSSSSSSSSTTTTTRRFHDDDNGRRILQEDQIKVEEEGEGDTTVEGTAGLNNNNATNTAGATDNITSPAETTTTTTTTTINDPDDDGTTQKNNCVAGGSGYGLSFDYTRKADLVSLRWLDIPQTRITVEFWYKSTDPFLKEACVFSYSAFEHSSAGGDDDADDPYYNAPNELSMRISRHRWNLWRGGGSECELHTSTNHKVEESYVDGKWHHYAFTIDSNAAALQQEQSAAFYLDGQQLDFGTTSISIADALSIDDNNEEEETTTTTIDYYTKAPYSNDWDVAESIDATDYYGTIQTRVVIVESPCKMESYQIPASTTKSAAKKSNPNNITALLLPSTDCSYYAQAILAVNKGAGFVVFVEENEERQGKGDGSSRSIFFEQEEGEQQQQQQERPEKLRVPVISVSRADGQAIVDSTTLTFHRSKFPKTVGKEFRQPIKPGGVLTLGQEPDTPWGGFDPFQAMNGIVDEFRVWDVVRTPEQIHENYRTNIDLLTKSQNKKADIQHLNLYYTFDDDDDDSDDNDDNSHNDNNNNNSHQDQIIDTKIHAKDHSLKGKNTGLIGALPTIRNQATFVNGDPPMPPTKPERIATTSSPLVGRGVEVVVPVVLTGGETIIELKSYDPEGEDLITKLVTSPTWGSLYGLDDDDDDDDEKVLSPGDIIVDLHRTEDKRVRFRALDDLFLTNTTTTSDSFQYSVQDSGGIPVVATVRLIPHIIENPTPMVVETVKEDSLNFWSLAKPSQLTQDNMEVVISSLPTKGTLYQIQLAPGKDALYNSLATRIDAYGPMDDLIISSVGTVLNNTRGIVMYAPNKDGFSDPAGSLYDTFGYRFVDPSAAAATTDDDHLLLESAEATVGVVVEAVNDPPEFDSTKLVGGVEGLKMNAGDRLTLKLDNHDVDSDTIENFSERNFARIVGFPKAGLLYQYDEGSETKQGGFMDSSIKMVPQVFAWASKVVRYSSQYSRCGKACYSWKNPACDSDCTIKGYTAEQILGTPNIYPDYRGGTEGMAFSTRDGGHEWLELEFPFEMYINGFELYETEMPGTLFKVSTTDNYVDDPEIPCSRPGDPDLPECSQDTNWTTLWSRPRESLVLGPEVATIFNPPFCASTRKTNIIKIEADTAAVPGWINWDAVKLIGSLDFPPGLVDDSHNRLIYIPRNGVHGADEVSFVFSDCLSEGKTQSLNLTIVSPAEKGEFSVSAFHEEDVFLPFSSNQVGPEVLDLTHVLGLISEVLEDESPTLSGIVWHTTALGDSSGLEIADAISPDAPQVTLNIGVANYGTPHSSIELWLSDKSSGLTFRIKYRLLLCNKGEIVDELAINGRNVCLVEDENLIPSGILAFGYLATGISWALSLYFLFWLYRNRNDSFVKVSQIEFLALICIGAMISSSTLIALGAQSGSGEDTALASAGCVVAPFLYTIGWVLQYSSLSAKTYRLYKITECHKKGEPQTVTFWSMFRIVIFAFCVDMAILVAWTSLNPLEYKREEIGRDIDVENGLITIHTYGQCRPSETEPSVWAFVAPLLFFHFALMIAANVLLIKVRTMRDRYQEFKSIALAMILMMEILIVGVPLLLAVEGSASADYGVLVAIIALHDIGILSFMFIPKVMLQVQGPEKKVDPMESIILASFRKMTDSRWDEGIQTVHDLLAPDSETRKLMTPQQAERLEDVKTLLVQGIRGNDCKASKTMHLPRSLSLKKISKGDRDDNVGFLLQEFAGVTDNESGRSLGSSGNSVVSAAGGETISSEAVVDAHMLPEFLHVANKEALFKKLSWEALKNWDYNVFDIADLTDGHPLLFVGWAILGSPYSQIAMAKACGQSNPVLDDFPGYEFVGPKDRSALRINMRRLCDYLRVIENDYVSENPYHNEIHASDVLQTTHSMLQMCTGVLNTTDVDQFSILLAAVVHDVAHPATNNAFQVGSKTKLAMIYNDASVLENRHASLAFLRMMGVDEREIAMESSARHDDLNILQNLSKKQFTSVRSKVIQAILGTDMSEHFRTVSMVKAMIMSVQEGKELSDDDTCKLLQYILHCADISNPGKYSPLFEKWTDRCLSEFFLQGDREAEMGLPVSPNCNRHTTKIPESQVGFITYIVLPSFEVLGMIIPGIQQEVVPLIRKNLSYWESRKGGKGPKPGLQARQDDNEAASAGESQPTPTVIE